MDIEIALVTDKSQTFPNAGVLDFIDRLDEFCL
jgi:hypothetical protein